MRITHNKNKSTTRYQVSGTELRNVTSYKDLGVIMASDLTWTINMFIKQTRFLAYFNAQQGVRIRTFFSILYKSLVRPILEYASSVWSPHLAKDMKLRRSPPMFFKDYFKRFRTIHNTRESGHNLLLPKVRTETARKSLYFNGSKPFNNIATEMKDSKSVVIFKIIQIKSFLVTC